MQHSVACEGRNFMIYFFLRIFCFHPQNTLLPYFESLLSFWYYNQKNIYISLLASSLEVSSNLVANTCIWMHFWHENERNSHCHAHCRRSFKKVTCPFKVGWIKASDQTILTLHNRVITNNNNIRNQNIISLICLFIKTNILIDGVASL